MTGLDIANELKELSEDMDVVYKIVDMLTSDLARDEIRKVLAVLGDEYNKKSNTDYTDKSNIGVGISCQDSLELSKLTNLKFKRYTCSKCESYDLCTGRCYNCNSSKVFVSADSPSCDYFSKNIAVCL